MYAEEMIADCLTKEKKSVGGDLTWKKIEKLLRMRVKKLKDKVLEGDVSSYDWLSTKYDKKSVGGDLTWEKIEKILRMRIKELKDKILEGDVSRYACGHGRRWRLSNYFVYFMMFVKLRCSSDDV